MKNKKAKLSAFVPALFEAWLAQRKVLADEKDVSNWGTLFIRTESVLYGDLPRVDMEFSYNSDIYRSGRAEPIKTEGEALTAMQILGDRKKTPAYAEIPYYESFRQGREEFNIPYVGFSPAFRKEYAKLSKLTGQFHDLVGARQKLLNKRSKLRYHLLAIIEIEHRKRRVKVSCGLHKTLVEDIAKLTERISEIRKELKGRKLTQLFFKEIGATRELKRRVVAARAEISIAGNINGQQYWFAGR